MSFESIKGYIMEKELPLVRFAFNRGTLVEVQLLRDLKELPYEYKLCNSEYLATELFLEDRVVPSTRQGLYEELKKAGIPYYSPVNMLKHNAGVSIGDDYWVKLL